MESTELSYVLDARLDGANKWLVMLAEKAQSRRLSWIDLLVYISYALLCKLA